MKTDNELIAEFMGYEMHEKNGKRYWAIIDPIKEIYFTPSSDLHYDTDWSELMPVVEKIASLEIGEGNNDHYYTRTFGMIDDKNHFMVRINQHPLFRNETLIGATYEAVVYFIKFYNEQPKP